MHSPPLPLSLRLWKRLVDRHEDDHTLALLGTGLFCVALVLVHGCHELWRDEIHCWSVARNAEGLWDLLTGPRRYDGHPFLWYYLLYLVSRWSRSLTYLHAVTIVLATTSAFLWLRYSGLPRALRVLLLGSYFFFFEYSVMSRSYALGVLLVFVFCHLYDPRSLRVVRLALVLALLSFTSAYGAMLGLAFGTLLIWKSVTQLASGRLWQRQRRLIRRQWLVVALLGAGVLALHLATSLPPADDYYRTIKGHPPGILSPDGFPKQLWSALFPWSARADGTWIVSGYLGSRIPEMTRYLPLLAGAMLALWLVAFRRVGRVAVVLAIGMLLIALFHAYQYGGYLRHWGHLFVLLVACLWLHAKHATGPSRLLYALATMTMALQAITCVRAVRAEVELPFSGALEAASYLRDNHLDQLPILGSYDHAVSAVAGYLDRRFVSAETGEYIQSVVFHNRRTEAPSVHDILEHGRAMLRESASPVVLLLNFDPEGESVPDVPDVRMELLRVTNPCLRGDETFWIYRLTLVPGAGTMP
jgi:hypothetical protein